MYNWIDLVLMFWVGFGAGMLLVAGAAGRVRLRPIGLMAIPIIIFAVRHS